MENLSLVRLLRDRAEQMPGKRAYTFLSAGEEVETLTFGQLDLRARAIAARLQERGAAGERALLLFPPGLDYITAFYGCLAAGAIAVPAYPPRMNRNLKRLDSVLEDSLPKFVLTTDAVARQLGGENSGALGSIDWLITNHVADEEASMWTGPHVMTGTLAFLQYTSASTSAAKGVMVSHGNIIHNQELMKKALHHDDETVIVSWLPLFHDMGLIGNVLASLYNGVPCHLMAPVDFLKKPHLWLEAIARYRGTFSGAPDFGYQLCVERIPAEEREGLDLSSWKVAFNGSEPVRPETLRNFGEAFRASGFHPKALFPCYGLAENTLFATGRFHDDAVAFTRAGLEAHRPRVAVDGEAATQLVSCGGPVLDQRVAIADPVTLQRCGEGEIGEIWLSSDSAAQGYWNQPELTERTFRAYLPDGDGPYMRTGDLGFLNKGELFVTGRLKDLIIIRGRNLVPQDIEQVVEQSDAAIRATYVAAVSVETAQGERLIIAAEVRREARHELDTAALIERVRSAVTSVFEVEVSAVALLRPGALPKTSSGKTQRAAVKRDFLSGALDCLDQWRSESFGASGSSGSSEFLGSMSPRNSEELRGTPRNSARGLETLERWLTARIASLAQMAVERIDRNRPILGYGLDSVVVISLLAEVEKNFGVAIDVEKLFDGEPSLREIVQRIQSDARGRGPSPVAARHPLPASGARGNTADNLRRPDGLRLVRTEAPDHHPFREHVNPELGRLLSQMGMDKSFVRGEGSWLWDETGEKYLDFLAQYGCLPFGFNPPRIWEALTSVRDTAEPSFVQPSFLNAAGELAKRLINVLPPGMQYVTFANSGAEAVEAAIKLCRSTTRRKKILAASNGFHGKTLGALSATDKKKYQEPFFAPMEGFDYVPYGDLDALRNKLAHGEYAGFFVEPLQGEGGIVEPPIGYLRQARKACRDAGTLFVADEIQTGLGRTGAMFVCSELGITPDIMTLAKALGGGLMPIGAMVATAAVYNEDFACNHTSTFAGNTLACRAGIATLDLLEENRGALVRQVAENGARLREGLLALQQRYPSLLAEVRGRGYFLGVKFGVDRNTFDDGLLGFIGEHDALTALIVSHLLHSEKIRVGYTLNHGGVLRIEPPLTATWEECRYFLDAFERVLVRMANRSLAALTSQVTGYVENRQSGLSGQAGLPVLHLARKTPLQPRADEGRFAFLVHPLAWKDFGDLDGTLSVLSDEQISKLSTAIADNFDPMVVAETRVTGRDGRTAYGEFVLVPRRAEELTTLPRKQAVAEVLDAARLAQKRGARIIGLGAYTSVVTQGGLSLKGANLPALTTGNSFTAIAARQAIRLAAASRGWTLPRRTVAVVGAGGSVGLALSMLLAPDAGRLILLGNPAHAEESRQRLLQVAGRIVCSLDALKKEAQPGSIASWLTELKLPQHTNPDRATLMHLGEELIRRTRCIEVSCDSAALLPDADVVVCCTSTTERIVRDEFLAPDAVVCDVSRPSNVAPELRERRPDVLVVDGGVVRLPNDSSLGLNASLAAGHAYACMAETMMLALQQQYEDTSLGFDLPLQKMLELERVADQLGFQSVLYEAKRKGIENRRQEHAAEEFITVAGSASA